MSLLFLLWFFNAQQSSQVCYGLQPPQCPINMAPACACTGPNVMDCFYLCLPKSK